MTGFVIFVVVMIVVSLISKAKQQSAKANRTANGAPNPRVQKVIERIQAEVQKNGGQPLDLGPKYAKYQQSSVQSAPIPPSSQQPPAQYQPSQYQPPGQYQAPVYQQPPAHRPPQNNLPRSSQDVDAQVRELMNSGHDVAAIRLLCDERDLGILEAQKYARALVAPAQATTSTRPGAVSEPVDDDGDGVRDEDTLGYVGSAAFAESIFDLDRDEEVWASGWVDTPEPEDRTDIEELWQTVSNPPRPGVTPPS